MTTSGTLLCIHRNPAQLKLLEAKGYGLITATNGSEGLRLLMSQPVDAIVVEYYLGLLNGAVVADEIKHVKPHLPIVMVADPVGLPEGALKSVDALVGKDAGSHSVWAAVHFLLNVEPNRRRGRKTRVLAAQAPRLGETTMRRRARRSRTAALPECEEKSPFSAQLWKSIRNGTVHF